MAKREFGGEASSPELVELVKKVRGEVRARLGPDSTFEERRTAASAVMAKAVELLLEDLETQPQQDQGTESEPPPGADLCKRPKRRE
jgi:hypothetical protein